MMIDGFLLGVIVTASLTASAFFWKFWRATRDVLFVAFSASFFIEGINRSLFLFLDRPNEGDPLLYCIRLSSYALILGAVALRNRS